MKRGIFLSVDGVGKEDGGEERERGGCDDDGRSGDRPSQWAFPVWRMDMKMRKPRFGRGWLLCGERWCVYARGL